MQRVALIDGPVRIAGVLDLIETDDGVRLRRLPAWTHTQISDPMTHAVIAMPSGCRLEMMTDAASLTLNVMVTRIATRGMPVRPAAFDLVVDGEYVSSVELDAGTLITVDPIDPTKVDVQRGEPSTVSFPALPASRSRVEVWLAHNAMVELRSLEVSDGATVEPVNDPRPRWLHYGSSISHCMEAERPTAVWPAVAAKLAGVDLMSFGFGGSCHLDQFVARTIRDLPVDMISLKVGINVVNADSLRERTFGPSLHGFLDTVRDGHPDVPLLLVSPIICPAAEDHPGPTVPNAEGRFVCVPRPTEAWIGSLTIRRVREVVRTIVAARRAAGDHNLHYLDGLELFGPADLADLPDDLHPNTAGYARMGRRFFNRAFEGNGAFAATAFGAPLGPTAHPGS